MVNANGEGPRGTTFRREQIAARFHQGPSEPAPGCAVGDILYGPDGTFIWDGNEWTKIEVAPPQPLTITAPAGWCTPSSTLYDMGPGWNGVGLPEQETTEQINHRLMQRDRVREAVARGMVHMPARSWPDVSDRMNARVD